MLVRGAFSTGVFNTNGLRKMGTPWIDGRGSRRRMRGRLDVVERERQGQEAILCLSKSSHFVFVEK
jgi:hypothetical protein